MANESCADTTQREDTGERRESESRRLDNVASFVFDVAGWFWLRRLEKHDHRFHSHGEKCKMNTTMACGEWSVLWEQIWPRHMSAAWETSARARAIDTGATIRRLKDLLHDFLYSPRLRVSNSCLLSTAVLVTMVFRAHMVSQHKLSRWKASCLREMRH